MNRVELRAGLPCAGGEAQHSNTKKLVASFTGLSICNQKLIVEN